VHLDTVTVVVGKAKGCFGPEEGLVLHPDLVFTFDHNRSGGVGIAVNDSLVPNEIAIRVDRLE
jgi:hypothetical protein